MDTLIQASKDGDDSKLQDLLHEDTLLVEDLPEEEESNEECMKIADRWFEGLLCKDISVTNEVYAVHNVEIDRQMEVFLLKLLGCTKCACVHKFTFFLLPEVCESGVSEFESCLL
ncbi:hypothetical protein PR202_gb25738 [Eleusine coracana subsp. coracana]|uniref:Uncharacterized protein n=1 Tax=Eleusine coracana subsp. coracana TaxID=191504 RepID=A0AAV5FQW8_ELECO|nr:hypothetical protein PR202_gb25738 [Eleusine coracana subsp. coracana]